MGLSLTPVTLLILEVTGYTNLPGFKYSSKIVFWFDGIVVSGVLIEGVSSSNKIEGFSLILSWSLFFKGFGTAYVSILVIHLLFEISWDKFLIKNFKTSG